MKMNEDLAHAILDVEDVCFGEGLGPATEVRASHWLGLVRQASDFVDRDPDSFRCAK